MKPTITIKLTNADRGSMMLMNERHFETVVNQVNEALNKSDASLKQTIKDLEAMRDGGYIIASRVATDMLASLAIQLNK